MFCNDWECPHNKDGKCTEKDAPCLNEILKEIFEKGIDNQ